ncbi:MAG: hypothetical protein IJ779_03150 [Ruminococcus sp.]|nr:hypothetical protein [Ruminococcus sp.]
MEISRMSNADMIRYCDEALAWEALGPIDIYFFQSVKNILLGRCSASEAPEEAQEDLMGIERPVRDVELEPEYGNYADIYYGEEGDDDIPNYSLSDEEEAFSADIFGDGFFAEPEDKADGEGKAQPDEEKTNDSTADAAEEKHSAEQGGSFTVNI